MSLGLIWEDSQSRNWSWFQLHKRTVWLFVWGKTTSPESCEFWC